MDNIIDICEELSQNFIEFAYEANSQRAFPDARDGLKPGQRACLWEMYSKGYTSDKPHVKCAKIDGGVIGAWWPHGQTAVYETFGRMSMPWVNNIPEVDFHGNNGNVVIGQALAADRYTEARLSKITEEGMFNGIKKNNVPMILNFSEDAEWPEVLPSIFQRLLVNGCQGIGLTVANTWLPMNMKEVGEVTLKYIKTGELDDNLELIDFCSGGEIINKDELPIIHKTGKGRVILRGTAEIKDNSILITELPYQVYVEPFIECIKGLIEKEEIKLIKNIYNKTDKKSLLIEIECDGSPLVVLNQLYDKTDLQTIYNANQMALVGKTPKLLTLQEYLDIYIAHNIECIIREYQFDLAKCAARQEIVTGLLKALEDIDNVIKVIKQSPSSAEAVNNLKRAYSLTDNQAKAIVDMKLGRLANLERIELQKESEELKNKIDEINAILSSDNEKKNILICRLSQLINKYGTARKTKLFNINYQKSKEEKEIAQIEPEKCVVVMTANGYIKRIPTASFRVQKRNGAGIKNAGDVISDTIRTNTVDSLLVFTNKGKVYKFLVNNIPECTNAAQGTPLRALIALEQDEMPSTIYSMYRDTEASHITFVTKFGQIKKTAISDFSKSRNSRNGTNAIRLNEGDSIVSAFLSKDENVLLISSAGMAICISSNSISVQSKAGGGTCGMKLGASDYIIAALPIRNKEDNLAIFLRNGAAKRIEGSFTPQSRGGKGIKIAPTGKEVAAAQMVSNDDVILVNGIGSSICVNASDISILGRTAQGIMIIKGSEITSVSKI